MRRIGLFVVALLWLLPGADAAELVLSSRRDLEVAQRAMPGKRTLQFTIEQAATERAVPRGAYLPKPAEAPRTTASPSAALGAKP